MKTQNADRTVDTLKLLNRDTETVESFLPDSNGVIDVPQGNYALLGDPPKAVVRLRSPLCLFNRVIRTATIAQQDGIFEGITNRNFG